MNTPLSKGGTSNISNEKAQVLTQITLYVSNLPIGSDRSTIFELLPDYLHQEILDIRSINRRHNVDKLSQTIAYIDFSDFSHLKTAQNILNNHFYEGKKLRAAPSDPSNGTRAIHNPTANQPLSIFAAKGKVYLYLNNLPYDVDEVKILKCVGLKQGSFRSKGGYGFLEIKDNFENWTTLNRMKTWKADKRKRNNRAQNPEAIKKVFWCSGRPCSLEVEKGRGRWRLMTEFDFKTKKLIADIQTETEEANQVITEATLPENNETNVKENSETDEIQLKKRSKPELDHQVPKVQKSEDTAEKKLKTKGQMELEKPVEAQEGTKKRKRRKKKSNKDFRSMLGL